MLQTQRALGWFMTEYPEMGELSALAVMRTPPGGFRRLVVAQPLPGFNHVGKRIHEIRWIRMALPAPLVFVSPGYEA